jgi:hypothetical protein
MFFLCRVAVTRDSDVTLLRPRWARRRRLVPRTTRPPNLERFAECPPASRTCSPDGGKGCGGGEKISWQYLPLRFFFRPVITTVVTR